MDLFLDAALGTAISELLRLVVTVEKRRGDFRGNLETLKNTLQSALLTLNELEKLNIILNRPEENTYQFINQLRQGVNLVKKCIKIPYWKRYKYSNKLAELDECIEKFFNVGVQGSVAVNTLRNGMGIQEINDKFDFMFKCLNIKYEPKIHVRKHHEALPSASCSGAYLCGASGWENSQGPPDEFEMLQVDAEIQSDSSDELSSWVIVPSISNSVVGFDKEPFEIISGPGSLQDLEIQTLEAGISELLQVIVAIAKLTQNFKTILRTLRKTLESVKPIFNDIEKLGILFNRPKEEIHEFKDQVNRGVNVVYKCSKIPESKTYSYSKTLMKLDTSILEFFQIQVQGFVNDICLDDQYAMTIACQSALPKDGSSRNPDDLVETPLYGGLKVVSRREIVKPTDGKNIIDTNRVLLDRLPTSLDASKEMKDSSSMDHYNDLISFPEAPRIPVITFMHMCTKSAYCLDLKDMNTHNNLVEPSVRNLPDVCTRGKQLGLKMEEASQIRKRFPGVVIREHSSEIIRSQASKCQATSTGGGKGKEKVVCKPKKEALKPKGIHYSLD